MRKLHDYDSELKALNEKVKQLKDRQVRQLGELVVSTGASNLDVEVLAGALLDAADRDDLTIREEWRTRGAAFFRNDRRRAARGAESRARSTSSDPSGTQSAAGETGAS